MPNTYTLIEKITVGAAGASSIDFTSIPQTYTDLVVKVSARGTRALTYEVIKVEFNGSTTNLSSRQLYGDGAAAGSSSNATQIVFDTDGANNTTSVFGSHEIYISNYAGSANKSVSIDSVMEQNGTTAYAEMVAGLWANTSAITSIKLVPAVANFAQYSTFYLYGIAKEGVTPSPSSAPYATGGDSIVFDGTYWIHTFYSSGTFTPKKGLTCDYLVVAGGGAGGERSSSNGGGGGAGGLRSTVTATGGGGSLESALSLAANTGYTVTVGAGGSKVTNGRGGNGSNSVFSTITSTGGGGGGGTASGSDRDGATGGSGGGSTFGGTGGSGTTNQGYGGGTGSLTASRYAAGGGGGAGAVGVAGGNSSGNGGAGVAVAISGSSATYAGGGGGGVDEAPVASGGSGGGGNGADNGATAAQNGSSNTGGGGGGDAAVSGAGNGGSGIVIIRYAA